MESILNNEEQDIVCVFQSDNKIDTINQNGYLRKCYDKLGELTGNLVILGSSLSDNDKHIFEQINQSEIEKIFISTTKFNENVVDKAKSKFPDKNISFIDINTISYQTTEGV